MSLLLLFTGCGRGGAAPYIPPAPTPTPTLEVSARRATRPMDEPSGYIMRPAALRLRLMVGPVGFEGIRRSDEEQALTIALLGL